MWGMSAKLGIGISDRGRGGLFNIDKSVQTAEAITPIPGRLVQQALLAAH